MSPCEVRCRDGAGVCPPFPRHWAHAVLGAEHYTGQPSAFRAQCMDRCGAAQPQPRTQSRGPPLHGAPPATRKSHQEKRALWPSALGARWGGSALANQCAPRAGLGATPTGRQRQGDMMATLQQCDSNATATQRQRDSRAMATQRQHNGNTTATQWQRKGKAMAMQWQCDSHAMATQWQCNGNTKATQRQSNGNAMAMQQQRNSKATPMQWQHNGNATATQRQRNGKAKATQQQHNGNAMAIRPLRPHAGWWVTSLPCSRKPVAQWAGCATPFQPRSQKSWQCPPSFPETGRNRLCLSPSPATVTPQCHRYRRAGHALPATRCLSPRNNFCVLIVSNFSLHTGRYKYS